MTCHDMSWYHMSCISAMFAISGIISKFECNFVIYTKINELGVKYFY